MKERVQLGTKCNLSELQIGQRGKVISLENENKELRRRLLDMGITQGVVVEIKKIAPFGDPIDVLVRGYELCIRKAEMKYINVEVTR